MRAHLPRRAAPARRVGAAPPSARRPAPPPSAASTRVDGLFTSLDTAAAARAKAPPSEKLAFADDVKTALAALADAGALPKYGAAVKDVPLAPRNVMLGELRQVGIKDPEAVARPSVRNDAAFLATVVGVSSVLAVLVGQLPGDVGGFGAYLVGGVPIAVLAVGSVAPGLLTFFTNQASRLFPDYRDRVAAHEAGHFLVAYLLGLPVAGYSLDIGAAHTDVAEAAEERRLIEGTLDEPRAAVYAVAAMAGVAGEARWSGEAGDGSVQGQTADLMDLQKVLNRTRRGKAPLSAADQQNMTRWAVWTAARLLRDNAAEADAVKAAMARGAGLVEVVRAIEEATKSK